MADINSSVFKFSSQGLLRWLEIPWTSTAHYFVLVKATKTPLQSDSLYSTISSHLCTSAGYAHKNVTNKVFLSAAASNAADCDSPDFGNGMVAKYLYLLSGTYTSPQAGDRIIGHWDLGVGNGTDITLNGILNVNLQGCAKFNFTAW